MIINVLVAFLVVTGCVSFIIGTIGVFRVPDAICRLHPSTICDTFGGGSILLAMAIYSGRLDDMFRIAIIAFFLFVSSAICGHAISRSVFKSNPDFYPVKLKSSLFPAGKGDRGR